MDRGQSAYTREKQAVFGTIIAAHMSVVKKIKAKYPTGYSRYTYVDLNAGSGFNAEAGVAGSPIIAASNADRIRVPLDMWLFETDDAKREELSSRLAGREVRGLYGDHRDHWRLVPAWHRPDQRSRIDGLVYWDPFGDPIPVDVINGLIAAPFGKVDVLLHLNANGAYKRPRGRGHSTYQGRYLADDIGRIDKRFWWIREPATDWQWTFLIGSNWRDMPEFRRLRFHPLDEPPGLDILDRLNLSKNEREAKLPRLPFDLDPPTEPTPNTSVTRASAPFAPLSLRAALAAASAVTSDRRPNRIT